MIKVKQICLIIFLVLIFLQKLEAQNYYNLPKSELCLIEFDKNIFSSCFADVQRGNMTPIQSTSESDSCYVFDKKKVFKINIEKKCTEKVLDTLYEVADLPGCKFIITYFERYCAEKDYEKLVDLPNHPDYMISGNLMFFTKLGLYLTLKGNTIEIYRVNENVINEKQLKKFFVDNLTLYDKINYIGFNVKKQIK